MFDRRGKEIAEREDAGHARALDLGGQRRAVVVGRGPLRQRREGRVRRLREAREERVLAERREARAARLEARAAATVVGRGRGRAGDAVGRVVVGVVARRRRSIRRVVDEQDLAGHLVGLGTAVGRLRGRAARLVARGEVRGERGAGQRRAEAARHCERVGAGLEPGGDGGAALCAERRAGPRRQDDDVARVAGPLAEEPRRRAGLELGPRRDDALGRVGPLRERFRDLRAH